MVDVILDKKLVLMFRNWFFVKDRMNEIMWRFVWNVLIFIVVFCDVRCGLLLFLEFILMMY